jgi:hypothetical protein
MSAIAVTSIVIPPSVGCRHLLRIALIGFFSSSSPSAALHLVPRCQVLGNDQHRLAGDGGDGLGLGRRQQRR